jgi:hypothetical protein
MASENFRARLASHAIAPTLAIHCSDPRFQPLFQRFLREHLGHTNYAPLIVPGGPHLLTLDEYLPKFAWAGWHWIKFLGDLTAPTRAILIAHDDCRWYHDPRFAGLGPVTRERQIADMRRAGAGIKSRYPGVRLEFYFGKLEDGNVHFEPV